MYNLLMEKLSFIIMAYMNVNIDYDVILVYNIKEEIDFASKTNI